MAKYHINPRGEVGICTAAKRPCPLSPEKLHFSDAETAREAAEQRLAREYHIRSFYTPSGAEELEFLLSYDVTAYGKDRLTTVDNVIYDGDSDAILMIRRGGFPWRGCWALPGGFIDGEEAAVHAAARELSEEAGFTVESPVESKGTLAGDSLDPRGYLETEVFLARVDRDAISAEAGDDADEVRWVPRSELAELTEEGRLVPHHLTLIQQALS